ncbi:MAG: radical SAM-associated putative lipoprotein [Bacteroidales bacterium]|nr:radical SAM-associated putative lipoprotein [Bacteroidales bacterium]MCL2738379.1 radical SAM-associated putative lipoprotein [Bacteroidales bacterium]
MKKWNRTWNNGAQWVIAGLLTLLGFSACGDKDEIIPMGLEYGTPHAKYAVKGKVTDAQGQALSPMRVIVPRVVLHTPARPGFIPDNPVYTMPIRDTLYTKPDGSFEYTYAGFPTETVHIHLKFEDPALQPVFESDSTRVDFHHSDLKGGDGRWNTGSAQKEADMTLKRKQQE